MPVSAPGSAGMETCFVNLVEPGDEVVVCRNGVFGERMRENVERLGATPQLVVTQFLKFALEGVDRVHVAAIGFQLAVIR